MKFDFIYTKEWHRIVQVILIDSRETSMPTSLDGNAIKKEIDQWITRIDNNSIFYKIENENGVLIGYFTLLVNKELKSATLKLFQLRKPFYSYEAQIKQQIYAYINSQEWQNDFLF